MTEILCRRCDRRRIRGNLIFQLPRGQKVTGRDASNCFNCGVNLLCSRSFSFEDPYVFYIRSHKGYRGCRGPRGTQHVSQRTRCASPFFFFPSYLPLPSCFLLLFERAGYRTSVRGTETTKGKSGRLFELTEIRGTLSL